MFVVTQAEAPAIRTAFEQRGELSAVIESRRLFPALRMPIRHGSEPRYFGKAEQHVARII
jgi:hypothetical protein